MKNLRYISEGFRLFFSYFLFAGALLFFVGCGSVHESSGPEKKSVTTTIQYESGHPFVEAKVNDQPALFLLDTGSPWTILDESLAKAAGISFEDAPIVPIRGVLGQEEARSVSFVDISIEGVTFRLPEALIVPSTPKAGTAYSGILGYDFFRRTSVTLDFPAKRVIISKRPTTSEHAVKVAGEFHGRDLLIPARIVLDKSDRALAGFLVLDTGFNGAVLLSGRETQRILSSLESIGATSAKVLSNSFELKSYRLSRMSLGSARFADVEADFTPTQLFGSDRVPVIGLIGARLFEKRRLTIDFAKAKIYISD